MISTPSAERQPYAVFAVLSLAMLALTAIPSLVPGEITEPYAGHVPDAPIGYFAPYFGGIPPLLAVGLVAMLGGVCLGSLQSRGWFVIFAPAGNLRGLAVAAIAAALFGGVMVLVEVAGVYRGPADLNVPPPYSMLFYPVIGYVVEIVFKAIPLALLMGIIVLTVGRRMPPGRAPISMGWAPLIVVATIEPGYQLSRTESISWSEAYLGVHVFAINLVQLYLFRRYDFVTMYWFRLAYYGIWHIGWGYLRLGLLF